MGQDHRAGLIGSGAGRASGRRAILRSYIGIKARSWAFVHLQRRLVFYLFLPLLELMIIYTFKYKCQA